MSPLRSRKEELLLESDLNRQVLQLELQQLRRRVGEIRGGLFTSRWKLLAPLAGVLVAWKFRRLSRFLTSGVGLFALRKLWDFLINWSKTSHAPARR